MNSKYLFPSSIKVKNQSFNLVKIQRDGITAIYKNDSLFLRIGDSDRILKDLQMHRRMLELGYPISEIVSDGFIDEYRYFIETSLGEESFSSIFTKETDKIGEVSNESFNDFLNIAKKLGQSQLKTVSSKKDFTSFSKDIHLDMLLDELPEYAEKIKDRFKKATSNLSKLPFVLTHGDFNPFNTHQKGIIDLENSSYAPFGYDVISGIGTTEYFPFSKDHESKDFEFVTGYIFSQKQKDVYFEIFDLLSLEFNLPKISKFREDLMFTRAIWLLVGMHKWPKIQEFRYKKFINEYLQD